jgi:homoserine kinase
MRAAFAQAGEQPPGLALRCVNRIPHGRGLGSSAAAIVAGITAARALAPDGSAALPDETVLKLATEIEGHPDNVAACLGGGLTVTWPATGGPRLVRLQPLPEIRPVVCVSPAALATEQTRKVLPEEISHRDAAANAGLAALLIAALTAEPAALLDATADRLHQPFRFPVMPETADLVGRLRRAGVPAVVSGAGPSVLAFVVPETSPGLDVIDLIAAETGNGWGVSPLSVDRHGARVEPTSPPVHPVTDA